MAAGDINTYGAIRSMTGEGKAAYASQIYDEAQGKFQDQINQETANEGLVSAKVAQTFTDAEKEQARTNIGAPSQATTYNKTQVDNLVQMLRGFGKSSGAITYQGGTDPVFYCGRFSLSVHGDDMMKKFNEELDKLHSPNHTDAVDTYTCEAAEQELQGTRPVPIGVCHINFNGSHIWFISNVDGYGADKWTQVFFNAKVGTYTDGGVTKKGILNGQNIVIRNRVKANDSDEKYTLWGDFYELPYNLQDLLSQDIASLRTWASELFAKKDGFYEQMTVGSALALAGQTQRTNDAMYRKSGGSEEVTTGTATIANIKGKTLAWNQRRATIEGYSYTANGITASYQNGVYTLSGTQQSTTARTIVLLGMSDTKYFVEGHKYAIMLFDAEGLNANVYLQDNYGSNFNKLAESTIITHGPSLARFAVYFFDKATELHTAEDVKFGLNYCDLTLIYGEGNEPTSVSQFEADYERWFGKPLTYEEYDEGSLRSVQLDALKTVGFNQYNNGSAKVIGGLKYQITGTYTSITLGEETITPDANGLFTPSTSGTLTIAGGGSDTCVHISGDRNGEYEPYEEHVAPLPVTTLKGKLNGQGESVTIFPDGMRSAGTIADEIYTVGDKTYAVQRVGSVDMGGLPYNVYSAAGGQYRGGVSGLNMAIGTGNQLCDKYSVGKDYNTIATTDKMLGAINVGGSYVFVHDSALVNKTVTEVKTAMQGVMLYYELAMPLVYEVEGFTLPKTYLVDGGGTEEQVQKSGVQGLAAILTCIYGVDAVGILDKLPRNYISEASMDNFLAKLNIATNGVWSKTFNENTGKWNFSFQSSESQQVTPESE